MPQQSKNIVKPNDGQSHNKLAAIEAVRGITALYVVLHHLWLASPPRLLHSLFLKALLIHGRIAVVVFFVISGFVIEYTTARRARGGFIEYFIKRWLRIYPIFLTSLAVAFVVSCMSSTALPEMGWRTFVGNVLMLQNYVSVGGVGVVRAYDYNEPLWSLAYEWWFYMLYYPIRAYIPKGLQLFLVSGMAATAIVVSHYQGPNQLTLVLALFPLWWFGVEAARLYIAWQRIPSMKDLATPLCLYVGMVAVLTLCWFAETSHPGGAQSAIVFQLKEYAAFASALAITFLWRRPMFAGVRTASMCFGTLAPFSYSLYLFHYPLLVHAQRVTSGLSHWQVATLSVTILVGLCWMSETGSRKIGMYVNNKTKEAGKAAALGDNAIANPIRAVVIRKLKTQQS